VGASLSGEKKKRTGREKEKTDSSRVKSIGKKGGEGGKEGAGLRFRSGKNKKNVLQGEKEKKKKKKKKTATLLKQKKEKKEGKEHRIFEDLPREEKKNGRTKGVAGGEGKKKKDAAQRGGMNTARSN